MSCNFANILLNNNNKDKYPGNSLLKGIAYMRLHICVKSLTLYHIYVFISFMLNELIGSFVMFKPYIFMMITLFLFMLQLCLFNVCSDDNHYTQTYKTRALMCCTFLIEYVFTHGHYISPLMLCKQVYLIPFGRWIQLSTMILGFDRKQSNGRLIDDDEFCSIALRSSPISKANSAIHLPNNCGTLSIAPSLLSITSIDVIIFTNGLLGTYSESSVCAKMCLKASLCQSASLCTCVCESE